MALTGAGCPLPPAVRLGAGIARHRPMDHSMASVPSIPMLPLLLHDLRFIAFTSRPSPLPNRELSLGGFGFALWLELQVTIHAIEDERARMRSSCTAMREHPTRPKRSLPRRSGPIGMQRRIWGGEASRRGPKRCEHRLRPAPARTSSTARALSRRPSAQDQCASDRHWPAGARIARASPNDNPAHRSRSRCASRRAGGRAFLSPFGPTP
jgi:hypothetical protein